MKSKQAFLSLSLLLVGVGQLSAIQGLTYSWDKVLEIRARVDSVDATKRE
jgi:hypothetical protein